MRTIGTTLVLLFMVIAAAGAGVVAGRLFWVQAKPQASDVKKATLTEELQLSPDQQEKMRTIWEQARDNARQCAEDARKYQHEYDDAVTRLLTPEQQAKYKELSDQAKIKTNELEQKRKKAFDKAVADTNAILSESQRKTYQQILSNRVGLTGTGPGGD